MLNRLCVRRSKTKSKHKVFNQEIPQKAKYLQGIATQVRRVGKTLCTLKVNEKQSLHIFLFSLIPKNCLGSDISPFQISQGSERFQIGT